MRIIRTTNKKKIVPLEAGSNEFLEVPDDMVFLTVNKRGLVHSHSHHYPCPHTSGELFTFGRDFYYVKDIDVFDFDDFGQGELVAHVTPPKSPLFIHYSKDEVSGPAYGLIQYFPLPE